MRAIALCGCCPFGAGRSQQKKAPPAEGGEKEPATANLDVLAAKCVWQGGYVNCEKRGTYLNEYKVGLATPDQIISLLKATRYLPHEVSHLEAKLVAINWKATTGFLYEKDFEDDPLERPRDLRHPQQRGPPSDDGRTRPAQHSWGRGSWTARGRRRYAG